MSAGKATVRTEQSEPSPERREQITNGVQADLRRLLKTKALLIATQFSANHEAEFDVSGAMAAIIERVEKTIQRLDKLCLEVSP